MVSLEIDNAFLAHKPIEGVLFEHNDYVRVIAGEYKEHKGSLVCILTLEPEPLFLLESEAGRDIEVPQSCIELIARDSQ